MRTPQEAAKDLIEDNFPIEKYQELQDHRKNRLVRFKEYGIEVLIKTEEQLIEHGEKVLKLLKEHYGRSIDNI